MTGEHSLFYTRRFTGWGLTYGLRLDLFKDGYEFKSTLGCLDAPMAMPGGGVFADGEYRNERAVFRLPDDVGIGP